MKITNRRSFLKLTGLGIAAASVSKFFSPSIAQAQTPAPQAVNEKDALAQSLGYHADSKKVDNKKWPKHAGAEGAKQMCSGCMFYQAKDAKAGQAPCQIFAGKLVKGSGWCNSWAKKA
jgi:anaerobic selenocysteine-containing dehydrogenase